MPEPTQIIEGINRHWILRESLSKSEEEDVWTAYDFTLYLNKAGLKADTIIINPMTRTRFLQECAQIFGKPVYAVRFLTNPDPAAMDLFSQEVEALMALDDPRIVRIHDYKLEVTEPPPPEIGEETDEEKERREKASYPPFYVMDKIEGVTLKEKAEKDKAYEGNIRESLGLIKDIGSALVKAHKAGLIHRDLKPKNIFVRQDGTPVIIDFGICQFVGGRRHSLTGEEPTDYDFIPPELSVGAIDESKVCPANDVYAVGKLLYYLISGGKQLPMEQYKEPEYDLRKKDPSRLMELVYHVFDATITSKAEARLQTIEDMLSLIDRELLEGSRCIFCRKGSYKPLSRTLMERIWGIREPEGRRSYAPRLMVCDNCGNVQNFCDVKIIEDELNKVEGEQPPSIPQRIEGEIVEGDL